MKTTKLNSMVGRSNGPGCPTHKIPTAVADLMETELKCATAGNNKAGLRWESNGIGVIFFECIKKSGMHIYILPTTNQQKWRTPKELKRILNKNNFGDLSDTIGTGRCGKDLRIRDVSWEKSLKVLPILAEWSYSSQTGKSLRRTDNPKSPRLPNNLNKTGKCKMPDGTTLHFTIIDQIWCRQSGNPNDKLICLQKLKFEDDGIKLRLGYYVIGKRTRAGKWVWGQYATILPPRDLKAIVRKAEKNGWI